MKASSCHHQLRLFQDSAALSRRPELEADFVLHQGNQTYPEDLNFGIEADFEPKYVGEVFQRNSSLDVGTKLELEVGK